MNELAGKKLTIYLDFDGTVVEHNYPKMGRCNFGCFEVIKKLQDAGHSIILNTYRADISKYYVDEALHFINNNHWRFLLNSSQRETFRIKPIENYTHNKIHPWPLDFKLAKEKGVLFIDDIAKDTPLIPAKMTKGDMVDWTVLDLLFIQKGVY